MSSKDFTRFEKIKARRQSVAKNAMKLSDDDIELLVVSSAREAIGLGVEVGEAVCHFGSDKTFTLLAVNDGVANIQDFDGLCDTINVAELFSLEKAKEISGYRTRLLVSRRVNSALEEFDGLESNFIETHLKN